jgi:hypothetical protein
VTGERLKSDAKTRRTSKADAKHFARSALECGGLTPLSNGDWHNQIN